MMLVNFLMHSGAQYWITVTNMTFNNVAVYFSGKIKHVLVISI